MRGFKIEAAGLEGGEETLNAPALAIRLQRPAARLKTDDDEVFFGQTQRGHVESVSIVEPGLTQDASMLDGQIVKAATQRLGALGR